MVFTILQIRSGAKIKKKWYGCNVSDEMTFSDLYAEFSYGVLDNNFALPEKYNTNLQGRKN